MPGLVSGPWDLWLAGGEGAIPLFALEVADAVAEVAHFALDAVKATCEP